MVRLQPCPPAPVPARLSAPLAALLAGRGIELEPLEGESAEDRDRRVETGLMLLFRERRDGASFEALYRHSRSMLLAWIVHLLAQRGQAGDPLELLQDTYVNVYRYAGSFREGEGRNFRGWARTIAANVVRKATRRHSFSLEMMPEGGAELADSRGGPAEGVLQREAAGALRKAWMLLLLHYAQAFQRLSPRDREALHLVEVEGLTYGQAGERLGVGRSNMKMIMFRSRKRIRAHILRAMLGGDETRPLRAVS